jgi:hypothetical protein
MLCAPPQPKSLNNRGRQSNLKREEVELRMQQSEHTTAAEAHFPMKNRYMAMMIRMKKRKKKKKNTFKLRVHE